MNKKSKFAVLLAVLFLVSCGKGADESKCLESVKTIFPNSKIYKHPDLRYSFYVIDSTGIKIVTTLNWSNANISGITQLVPVK